MPDLLSSRNMFLFSMLHRQKPSYRTPLHCCNCCSAPHLQQSEGEGETYRRVGGSADGRNETAYRRVGTRGAVGLRSRATGVARLETSLLLITPPQPFILRSLLFACSSSITCNAGRAGAQPYRATRADTPIRRPAVSFLPHADPPTRPYAVSFLPTPPRSRWRYFDRSVPESAHLCSQNLGKDPHPVFVLFKSNLPLEGVLLLIMTYWTYDGGLGGSASLAVIVHFLSS